MLDPDNLLYKKLPKYADGGGVKTTMQEVHVNPAEVHHMDFLQGGPRFTSTGKRSYRELGKLLKNPHIAASYHDHVAEHRANGGPIGRHEHALASNGRYGDTEVCEMPHHMVELMNRAQGGATHNPWDGKPEYFLGGLFKSFASKLAPMAGKLFSGAASGAKRFASKAAPMAGKVFSGAASGAKRLASKAAPMAGKLFSGAASAAKSVAPTLANVASEALPIYAQHRMQQQQQRQQEQQQQQQQQHEQQMMQQQQQMMQQQPHDDPNDYGLGYAGHGSSDDDDDFHDARGTGVGVIAPGNH